MHGLCVVDLWLYNELNLYFICCFCMCTPLISTAMFLHVHIETVLYSLLSLFFMSFVWIGENVGWTDGCLVLSCPLSSCPVLSLCVCFLSGLVLSLHSSLKPHPHQQQQQQQQRKTTKKKDKKLTYKDKTGQDEREDCEGVRLCVCWFLSV